MCVCVCMCVRKCVCVCVRVRINVRVRACACVGASVGVNINEFYGNIYRLKDIRYTQSLTYEAVNDTDADTDTHKDMDKKNTIETFKSECLFSMFYNVFLVY